MVEVEEVVGRPRSERGRAPGTDRGVSAVALTAGVAGLTAAIAASVLPGLLETVSQAPEWGMAWGDGAVGADAAVAGAVAGRLALAAGLLAVVAAQGLFTVGLLLLGERDRRGAPLAVRLALGAGPRALVAYIVRRDARRIVVQVGVGIVLGVLAGLAMGATWPGIGVPGATSSARGVAAVVLVALGGAALLLSTVAAGLLSPLVGLGRRTPTILRRGRAVTDDPRAGTVRRGAASLQLAGAVAFALTGLALVRSTPASLPEASVAPSSPAAGSADETRRAVVPAISRYAVGPGTSLDGHLLASPGAWIGVGVRDLVTVECGACVVGVWYMPVYGVDSTVHAVGPGVLDALGAKVVEGRGVEAADSSGAPLVAVVNETFRRHFEGGAPIGRRIRLSGRGDRWVEVVGVVRDVPIRAPGAPASDDPVLWLAQAQHPAAFVEGVASGLEARGLTRVSYPRPLDDVRAAALAPAVWSGWVLLWSGTAALLLALVSALEVGRVEARGMARATAVRLAVGGPPRRLARRLLTRTARLSGVAVGVGLLVSWVLQAAVGGGSIGAAMMQAREAPWLALVILLAAVGGAAPRARALLRLEPARLLRED